MFEKILYPTDFSDVAKKALNFIKQLKGAGAKEVIVLHVVDMRGLETLDWHTASEGFRKIRKDLEENITKETSSIENELSNVGLRSR